MRHPLARIAKLKKQARSAARGGSGATWLAS
jgi:hypothetical protein